MQTNLGEMRLALVLLLSVVALDARVQFAKSEVLDNVDLKGANAVASFRCSNGCTVYSPTLSDKVIVVDAGGNQMKTLRMLADDNKGFELPAAKYSLKNTGQADPSFVFYAVEKGAANYGSTVFYQNTVDPFVLTADAAGPVTLLSSTGAVSFQIFSGFSADNMPTVYAAGFDSIDTCRPVYNPRSLITLAHTSFPVNSPIATINIKKGAVGQWVSVGGDSKSSSMAVDASGVYVTPGYVGCPNVQSVGDSLYTFLPNVQNIETSVSLTDSNGLSTAINGDFSIANQADALTLTVNGQATKLFGKNTYSKSYDDTKANVQLSWSRKANSKDGFAMQVDISSKGTGGVQTTTKSVNSLAMIVSSVVVSLFLAVR